MIYILNIDSRLYADKIYWMNLFVGLWILFIEEGFGDTFLVSNICRDVNIFL